MTHRKEQQITFPMISNGYGRRVVVGRKYDTDIGANRKNQESQRKTY